MALPRNLKELAFGAGIRTKGDPRAEDERILDIAVNVEFDEIGNLRCRYPFDGVRTALVGGGTLSNARRFAMLGDELVCFTSTALYSWIPALSAWEYRGDHLAVATDEQTVFSTPGDQDCADRVELNGHIVYCWHTIIATGINAGLNDVLIAIRDKTTGAVVQGPTSIRPAGLTGASYVKPRLVALASSVLIFWYDVGTTALALTVGKITVNPYSFTPLGFPLISAATEHFDVCRIPGQDRCYVASPTGASQYKIASVDSAFSGAVTTGTVAAGAANPIAIAVTPDAAFVTVVNSIVNQIIADIWNVTAAGVALTSVSSGTRLDTVAATQGASTSQVTAAYRLTQDSGRYRCYVFWSRAETAAMPGTTVFASSSSWIDSTAATGVPAVFVYGLGIAARAFARDSHVYLVGVFAGLSFSATDPSGTFSALQNTYYLYRDDAFLIAKAVWGEGGGFNASGWLPNVTNDSGNANAFVLMAAIRRVVPVGSNATNPNPEKARNYAERAPRETTFTFDDNRARRCVQFGETLYVLGGIVFQYDGTQLVELGTNTYPWQLNVSTGAAGAVPAGGYSYKATDRWMNAKGEVDRSTTATVANFTAAGATKLNVAVPDLNITRKANSAIEIWRTKVNPVAGAPFLLVTSQDPSVLSGDNRYVANATTSGQFEAFTDNFTDAQIAVLPANPDNGAVLPALEPPPATIAYADNQRVYLAGVAGYPNTVYYSKYRQVGQVAAFNDGLTFDVPSSGGPITAIGYLDGALIVWCQTATYQFAGLGLDDTGGGGNFQLSRTLSTDLGCIGSEACVYFDGGFLVKTNKGWFVLDRSLTYQYVGEGPFRYDGEAVLASTALTSRHQVRILTSARILVFDTLVNEWAETSVSDGLDMLLWNGTPAYLTATGMRAELATWVGYAGTDYSLTQMDLETNWIKFGGMQSRAIVDFVQLLGELRSTCVIRKRLAKDYEAVSAGVWNYNTDVTWTPYPATAGGALQVRQAPRRKRCEALKARFTVTAQDGVSPLGGPCAVFTSIVTSFAVEPNAYGAVSAAQKQ